jgi:hypothetical protein
LEVGTKDEIRILEALFKGVSTRFGLRTIEKSVENPDFIFCSSFQNLRLGSINLHFEHFDKNVNHESRLTLLSKCSKWRLSKKRGLVADGWIGPDFFKNGPIKCTIRLENVFTRRDREPRKEVPENALARASVGVWSKSKPTESTRLST